MIYVFLLLGEGVSSLCLNGLAISNDYIQNMNLNINEINKGGKTIWNLIQYFGYIG